MLLYPNIKAENQLKGRDGFNLDPKDLHHPVNLKGAEAAEQVRPSVR